MTQNLKVVWNAVSMFLSCDRETGWRVRDSWPNAGGWSTVIVMREPVLQKQTQVVFRVKPYESSTSINLKTLLKRLGLTFINTL
jgi:hypothetical protein